MSTAKLQGGIAALLIVITAGTWFVLEQNLLEVRAEIQDAQGRLNQIAAGTAAANRQAADERTSLDALSGISFTVAKSMSTLPTMPGISPKVERARLDANYSGLFRSLKLSAPALENLKDLLAERRVREWAVRRFAVVTMGQWMDEWANKTDELEFIAAGTQDIDERIRSLLGEEKYSFYAAYEKTLPWRAPFTELAEQLRTIDPLRDDQIDQLAAWSASANPGLFGDKLKSGPTVPAHVITQAEGMLTPLQLEKLIQLKASTDAYKQMLAYSKDAARRDALHSSPATGHP